MSDLKGKKKIKFIENLNNCYGGFNAKKTNLDMKYDNGKEKQIYNLPHKDLKIYNGIRNIDDESDILISRSNKLNGKSNNILSGIEIPRYTPHFINPQNVTNIVMDFPRGGISTRICD